MEHILELATYGSITLAGMLAGSLLVWTEVHKRFNLSWRQFLDLLSWMVPAGYLGAKLAGILDYQHECAADPVRFFLGVGFASSWGGLILGSLAGMIWLRRKAVPLPAFLDTCVPGILLAYAIGRLGCHITGDGCYGISTNLPWGCSYPDGDMPTLLRVHPAPLYEASYALMLLLGLGCFRQYAQEVEPGALFGIYMVLHWTGRFAVEFIRINPRHGPFSAAQWVSLCLVIIGLTLILSRWCSSVPKAA